MPDYVITIDYGREGLIAYRSQNRDLAHARRDARRLAKEERDRGISARLHRVESEKKDRERMEREGF